jgi:hypothetical protein
MGRLTILWASTASYRNSYTFLPVFTMNASTRHDVLVGCDPAITAWSEFKLNSDTTDGNAHYFAFVNEMMNSYHESPESFLLFRILSQEQTSLNTALTKQLYIRRALNAAYKSDWNSSTSSWNRLFNSFFFAENMKAECNYAHWQRFWLRVISWHSWSNTAKQGEENLSLCHILN